MLSSKRFSIVLPAKNESESLKKLLPRLVEAYPNAEIIVVNDGSDDDSAEICRKFPVLIVNHPYSKGNGAAIKSGARAATHEIVVFMDADSQHQPKYIEELLARLDAGFDMVVAERKNDGHASIWRGYANYFYNWFASMMTGHMIGDLTSGFRVVRANKFKQFLYLLPNGFSYPSTITMAFFRAGYSVDYVPVNVLSRVGKSHLRPLRDGIRFLLIIFKVTTLYSPLKIFAPASVLLFLTGSGYYAYTYMTQNRFTNMSALLFIIAILVFLIGLVSEQVTTLLYSKESPGPPSRHNDD